MQALEAREELGLSLRRFRGQKRWNRKRLGKLTGLKPGVIADIEHGNLDTPKDAYIRVMRILVPAEEESEVDQLFKTIHPPRQRQAFRLHITILRRRRRGGRRR